MWKPDLSGEGEKEGGKKFEVQVQVQVQVKLNANAPTMTFLALRFGRSFSPKISTRTTAEQQHIPASPPPTAHRSHSNNGLSLSLPQMRFSNSNT